MNAPHEVNTPREVSVPREASVLRDLLRLATPVLISQLAVMANGVVDTLMAGWLSATDLASIGLGTSIYIIAYVSLLSVLMGLSPIAAQHYGAQRFAAIGVAFRQSILLALGLGVVGAALLLQTDLWLGLSAPPPEVASRVADYLQWCALGVVPALLVRAFSALCTAVSLPRIVMWINLGMLLLKVPLNAALMYGVDAVGLEGLGAPGRRAVPAYFPLRRPGQPCFLPGKTVGSRRSDYVAACGRKARNCVNCSPSACRSGEPPSWT